MCALFNNTCDECENYLTPEERANIIGEYVLCNDCLTKIDAFDDDLFDINEE